MDAQCKRLQQPHLHCLCEATDIDDVNAAEIGKPLFHVGYEPESIRTAASQLRF